MAGFREDVRMRSTTSNASERGTWGDIAARAEHGADNDTRQAGTLSRHKSKFVEMHREDSLKGRAAGTRIDEGRR